jgi:hypothetical protein
VLSALGSFLFGRPSPVYLTRLGLSCLRGRYRENAWYDKIRRSGFIEGQNLAIEYRPYAQHFDLVNREPRVAVLQCLQPTPILRRISAIRPMLSQ